MGNPWHKQGEREDRLNHGVGGAHLLIPFQCEVCHMRNLEGRDFLPGNCDEAYRMSIRRANLDAMAGRAVGTIQSHVREAKLAITNSQRIGKTPRLPERGPHPLEDTFGMSTAVDMMQRSITSKGRNEKYIQFDTLRKGRSLISVMWESSPTGVAEGCSIGFKGGRVRFTTCPTQSLFFSFFIRGCEDRMGYESRAQKALPIEAIVAVLEMVKEDAVWVSDEEANELYKFGACLAILQAASLRGNEAFYADLAGLRRHISEGKNGVMPRNPLTATELRNAPHVMLTLMGKFKGETTTCYHMIGLSSTTLSGIQTRWWLEKLIRVRASEGCVSGPAFGDKNGRLASQARYNDIFRMYLKRVQNETIGLIAKDDDIDMYYGLSRTPRKTAVQRARNAGLGSDVVDAMNRWETIEAAGARKASMKMRDHYSDARQMMPVTWRYAYVQ